MDNPIDPIPAAEDAPSKLSGLPIIGSYRAKELRREADKRLREQIARRLDSHRRKLTGLQRDLVSAGKLKMLPDLERAVGRLQLLIDSIRTAAYGYAPFFDLERVREEQLDRLMTFDRELADRVPQLQPRIDALAASARSGEGFDVALETLMTELSDLQDLFTQRRQSISAMTTAAAGVG